MREVGGGTSEAGGEPTEMPPPPPAELPRVDAPSDGDKQGDAAVDADTLGHLAQEISTLRGTEKSRLEKGQKPSAEDAKERVAKERKAAAMVRTEAGVATSPPPHADAVDVLEKPDLLHEGESGSTKVAVDQLTPDEESTADEKGWTEVVEREPYLRELKGRISEAQDALIEPRANVAVADEALKNAKEDHERATADPNFDSERLKALEDQVTKAEAALEVANRAYKDPYERYLKIISEAWDIAGTTQDSFDCIDENGDLLAWRLDLEDELVEELVTEYSTGIERELGDPDTWPDPPVALLTLGLGGSGKGYYVGQLLKGELDDSHGLLFPGEEAPDSPEAQEAAARLRKALSAGRVDHDDIKARMVNMGLASPLLTQLGVDARGPHPDDEEKVRAAQGGDQAPVLHAQSEFIAELVRAELMEKWGDRKPPLIVDFGHPTSPEQIQEIVRDLVDKGYVVDMRLIETDGDHAAAQAMSRHRKEGRANDQRDVNINKVLEVPDNKFAASDDLNAWASVMRELHEKYPEQVGGLIVRPASKGGYDDPRETLPPGPSSDITKEHTT